MVPAAPQLLIQGVDDTLNGLGVVAGPKHVNCGRPVRWIGFATRPWPRPDAAPAQREHEAEGQGASSEQHGGPGAVSTIGRGRLLVVVAGVWVASALEPAQGLRAVVGVQGEGQW